MRILALADTQLGAGRQLADDRLADQEAALDRIASLAHERDVDVVLHLGDVFETRHPGEEERMVFKRWAHKVTYATLARPLTPRLIVLAGNHDLRNASLASAVDLYDRCEFVRLPTVLDLGGCSLACLPWAPIHNLVAARDSREGVYEQAAEALVAIARDLSTRTHAGKPLLLAAHWSISGVALPNGMTSDQLGEVIIPQETLYDLFDIVLAGHLHARGWFSPNALYAGSPYPNNFGEANDCGVWIWDSESALGDVRGSMEYVPLESRRLVTIDCDLTQDSFSEGAATDTREEGPRSPTPEEGDWTIEAPGGRAPIRESNRERNGEGAEHGRPAFGANTEPDALLARGASETDVLIDALCDHLPLTDATVRIRYRCTEDQHRRVDTAAVKRAILAAGAHKVYSVEPAILRETRARAQGVDESLEPQQALAAWCNWTQISENERAGLAGLLARYST